jgi:hypothetical protein
MQFPHSGDHKNPKRETVTFMCHVHNVYKQKLYRYHYSYEIKLLTVLTTILLFWRWCHVVWDTYQFSFKTLAYIYTGEDSGFHYCTNTLDCLKQVTAWNYHWQLPWLSCIIISHQFAKRASTGCHFICIDTTVTYQWIMQFHQFLFLQWHLDVCWNSPPSHIILNYTQQCKFDNISYIHAHAQMMVIYTYFS